MKYKTLLVHLDDSARCDMRIAFALDLARRWDAHVIGVYAVNQDLLNPLYRGESLKLGVSETQHAARRLAVEDRFVAAGTRAGLEVEWRAPPGEPADVMTLHARHADLLILGQSDPDDRAAFVARHFLDDVLMDAGRPAVLLPHSGGAPQTFGENVLVAWDGGREAARALADALPILKRARFVTVEIVERRGERAEAPSPAGIDVAAYLSRHGIEASFSSSPHIPGLGTGAALLNRAADLHADLVVMGAYGHTRARERVLGGVTQLMLESMTTPVLMSH